MKIMYLYQQFTQASGTERVFIDKINYFAECRGFEMMLVTNQQGNHQIIYPVSSLVRHVDLDVRFCDLYKYRVIRRMYMRFLYYRLYKKRLNNLIRDFCPDIVVCATYYLYIVSAVSRCPFTFTRILESHIGLKYLFKMQYSSKRDLLKKSYAAYESILLKKYSRKFDVVVTLDPYDSADWSRYLACRIILNVVHLNPINRFCDYESKKVIFVGRYMEQKGIPDLYQIWQLVHKQHPEWYLDLYGSGNLKEQIKEEASILDVNITVNGQTQNIFEKYLEHSILVVTSLFEPFGLVIPEAMSCGLPVIAFDCPFGPANIISDGIDGFLIKDRDVHMFAERLSFLMDSPQMRYQMGHAGIVSSQRFSSNKIMPQWEQLFNELMN